MIGKLEGALSEKMTLLHEVHHRVKNNLQVISSLLRMQSNLLEDQQARSALRESQRRVLSMALIHERLYGSQQMNEIDFGEYTRTLVRDLLECYTIPKSRISSRIDASEIRINVEQAVPCALILNELITNALKYAYPIGEGEIFVRLEETFSSQIRLTVTDNGVGLPEGFDWRRSTSMGLPIVEILAKQLGGEVSVESGSGTTVKVFFPKVSAKTLAAVAS